MYIDSCSVHWRMGFHVRRMSFWYSLVLSVAEKLYSAVEIVSSWIQMEHGKRHMACMELLSRLRIVTRRDGGVWKMHGGFQRHVQKAQSGGIHSMTSRVSEDVVREGLPQENIVHRYAWEQWENVLLYALGERDSIEMSKVMGRTTSLDLSGILVACDIIQTTENGELSITENGFQFLLSDTHRQVWVVLQEYIKHAESHRSRDLFDSLIEFLLQLGFQTECFAADDVMVTEEQKEICSDLCQLGLLFPFTYNKKVYLVPTKLSVMLSSTSDMVAQEDGFIIVETNYRVYAYTSSLLKQSILRLFIRCDVLLPNMVVGTITRDSVMSALDSGIKADQIIGYLTQHCHKRVSSRVPIVPGVVADQIRLWQQEIQRLQVTPAVLYKNFETPALYKQVVAFAEGIGSVILVEESKQEFLAMSACHERIRNHIKLLKQNM